MSDTAPSGRAHRVVGFQEAFKLAFSNYANFRDRSSRGAFWYWVLASWIVSVVLSVIDYVLFGGADNVGILEGIWGLATLFPAIAIGARRLHDINRTGWWQLLSISIIGVVVLIYWWCQPGEAETNRFGPDREAGRG
ncbi:DUF805 domain-containing protein [Martelella sp. HB161492]|uniref:DUF805 domain-containing protein n=1 Tax=Martelella sp. HB161492 TaxID=2720726 RepID=UPI001592A0DF|nr:DUF805 domain-containing protein [Martelella sp. HB161492]